MKAKLTQKKIVLGTLSIWFVLGLVAYNAGKHKSGFDCWNI